MKTSFLKLCVVFTLVNLSSCTDEAAARRTLDDEGYTDVQITGFRWFGCGDDTSTGFTAKNTKGKPVDGVVCCGYLMKACTVRW